MGRRAASNGAEWPADCHDDVEDAIAQFRRRLPGWWYSLGECQVSCDASCAPTHHSPDIELIDFDRRFDSGFHADLAQRSPLAASLRMVIAEELAVLAPRGTLAIATRHGPVPAGRPLHDTPIDEMPGHARRLGLGSLSSKPMADALGRDDVRWIPWTMRGP